jgi:pilus assembly protein CpaC
VNDIKLLTDARAEKTLSDDAKVWVCFVRLERIAMYITFIVGILVCGAVIMLPTGRLEEPVSISLHDEQQPIVIKGDRLPDASTSVMKTAPSTSRQKQNTPQKLAALNDEATVADKQITPETAGEASTETTQTAPANKPRVQVEQSDDSKKSVKLDTGLNAARLVLPLAEGRILRFDEEVDSVFIADPEVADVKVLNPTQIYVFGKRAGETNLIAVSSASRTAGNPALAASLKLYVSTAPQANETAGLSNFRITFQGNRLVLRGSGNINSSLDAYVRAKSFNNDVEPVDQGALIGSNQVNIRVRFAEVSRADIQSLGLDWGFQANAGTFSLGISRRSWAEPGTTTSNLAPSLRGGGGNGNFSIDVVLEALQRNGMVNMLAEPNLTTVTGKTASFLAGGEIGVPVMTPTANSYSVSYKPFGVSLEFTPTIIRNNRIALQVKPEVSTISGSSNFGMNGANMPTFAVRRADTTVEVASGQTFAIAGLFQRDLTRSVEKFPLLGDLPILGKLFQSERYKRNETELVILITPYLVNPVSQKTLVTPLDRAENQEQPWKPEPKEKAISIKDTNKDTGQSGFVFK